MKIKRKKTTGKGSVLRRRVDMKRGVFLLPNIITTANLFCGFLSIIKSLQGDFVFAAYLIILAGFLDFLDGRVARLIGASSDFGCEFDSLSDLVTFVVSPTVMVYLFGLKDFGKIGIAAGFLFVACGALRLARYNVQSSNVEKVDFQGMPTPSGGGMLSAYVLFYLRFFDVPGHYPVVLICLVVALALLMVSSVRYRSLKQFHRSSFVFLILLIAFIVVIAMEPEIMFFAIGTVYISTGVIAWIWKSPQKIRGLKDLLLRFYNERNEDLFLSEEESVVEDIEDISTEEDVSEEVSENKIVKLV